MQCSTINGTIKHRVQNPRRVTKPEPIASTHAQMGPRTAHIILVGVSIASMELATKILRACAICVRARVHVT